MNRDETKVLLRMVNAVYQNFNVDEFVLNTWADCLVDSDFERVKENFKDYVRKGGKFRPVVADLVDVPEDPKMYNNAQETYEYLKKSETNAEVPKEKAESELKKMREILGIKRG